MRTTGWTIGASVALLVALVLAVSSGPGDLNPLEAWGQLIAPDPLGPDGLPTTARVTVRDLRLPRALLAALLGASLGAAGAVTQGLFRNALAEPSVLGVSTGAALAAVVGFSLRLDVYALWATPLLAGAGACLALLLLFGIAGRSRGIATLLLCGIALSSFCAAIITLLLAWQVERWELGLKVMAWLMGSLEARSWSHLTWALPPSGVGIALALWLRKDLDLLLLGEETAVSLGMHPGRMRLLAILCVAVLVGGATALAGVIGFVGLIVPHVARLIVGPRHRRLMPFSLVLGAVVLVMVDTVSRNTTGILLPPGVITVLLGAPFFLWLLRRHEAHGLG